MLYLCTNQKILLQKQLLIMENSFRKIATNYGVILGVILSLITVFAYAIMLELYTKWWFGTLVFAIVIIIATIAAVKSKKLLGGYISFKDAFTSYFITVMLGTLISTLVGILIFNFIDPEAARTLQEMMLENTRQMMENWGTPQAAIDEAMAAAAENDTFSIGAKLQQYVIGLVIFCVVGLIVALSVRKKDPNAVSE